MQRSKNHPDHGIEFLPIELYNLKQDASERHNVASQHPETVAKMERLMENAHTPLNQEKGP